MQFFMFRRCCLKLLRSQLEAKVEQQRRIEDGHQSMRKSLPGGSLMGSTTYHLSVTYEKHIIFKDSGCVDDSCIAVFS